VDMIGKLEKERRRHRLLRRLVIGGVFLPFLYILIQWAVLFIRVDRCMDHGGIYDYRKEACCADEKCPKHLPYVSFCEHRREMIIMCFRLSCAIMVVGSLLILLHWKRLGNRQRG
jgi:hypothetical protein